ncbi:MAG: hypothetical protein R3C53_16195 [Pirellulaceae bacterium]
MIGLLLTNRNPLNFRELFLPASDRPYTTPDAWLYRDLFNGTYGWPPA